VLASFRSALDDRQRPGEPSILDVGCGHGRFLRFLRKRLDGPFAYLGIDSSRPLLRRIESAPGVLRIEADLLAGELPAGPAASFDLIAVFGLLHHLPGLENRSRLLHELRARLRPAGVLALSFWQFGERPRFQRRVLPWRLVEESVDIGDLEPGDLLLSWGEPVEGDAPQPRRYCHYAPPDEAAALTAGLGLRELDRFRADGRSDDLNLYVVLGA
jgi:SAM-dependent methyltransferase